MLATTESMLDGHTREMDGADAMARVDEETRPASRPKAGRAGSDEADSGAQVMR